MPLDARLNSDGTKIILRGFSTDLLSFYRTLPEAKFVKTYAYWVCNKTPASLVRILCNDEFGTCCDQFRQEAADAFGKFQKVRHIQDPAYEPKLVPPTKMPLWNHQRKGFEVAATLGYAMLQMGMGCISGDAEIVVCRAKITRKMKLRETFRLFQKGNWKAKWHCRALKGDRFGQHPIENIIYTGIKETVVVTLDNGKSIRCTPDHRIAQPGDKWTPASTLQAGDEVLTNGGTVVLIPKVATVLKVAYAGATDVYDIQMADPWHNFVADGVVVHNCGKSATAVGLVKHWSCKNTLIMCPKSVLGVWRREFERHHDGPISVIVLGDNESVPKRCLRAVSAVESLEGPVVIVVNYEAVWRKPLGEWVLNTEWDCAIADESQKCRSRNSEIGKFVAKLHYKAKHRLCLTGTPMSQGPTDLYGQFKFLDPGVYGTTWTAFCDQFIEKLNPAISQMITGYKNQEVLKERMAWMTFHCKSEDVLDLPAVHHIERRFKLSREGQRVYSSMLEDMIAEFKDGVCTAANAMVKVLRLSQVTSGYLQHDDSDVVEEFDQEKLEQLREILDDLDPGEPVVVFCRFRRDLDRVRRMAAELGRRYGEISGDCKDALTEHATMRTDIDLAGAQIAAGGLGIDLTRASYCVYYSIGYSLAEYAQSVARLHRPGQNRVVHYYHLIAEKTVDCDVYQAMEKKQEIIDAILDVFGVQKPVHHQVKESA